jgi:hypothetical protein
MSYCTPCPPCDTNFPLLCEPLETTANGKRLVVEDSAACQKTIQSPVAQQVLKTDGAGNLTWTNGASGTVLRKDSTGLLEFATLNSVLQSGPVDLGSQPLTTTGTINAGSVTATGAVTGASAVFSANSSSDAVRITQTGTGNALKVEDSTNPDSSPFVIDSNGNAGIGIAAPTEKLDVVGNIKSSGNIVGAVGGFESIEVGSTSGLAFIDIKNPTVDDYDLRLTTDGTNGLIASYGNINIQPATSKSIVIGNISTYANNAAAIAGGLIPNSVYKTSTGELRIVV